MKKLLVMFVSMILFLNVLNLQTRTVTAEEKAPCCNFEVSFDYAQKIIVGAELTKCANDPITAKFWIRNACKSPLYLDVVATPGISGPILPVDYRTRKLVSPSTSPTEIKVPFIMPSCTNGQYIDFNVKFEVYRDLAVKSPCKTETLTFRVKCLCCCQWSRYLVSTIPATWPACLNPGQQVTEVWKFYNNSPAGCPDLCFYPSATSSTNATIDFNPTPLCVPAGQSREIKVRFTAKCPTPNPNVFEWKVDIYKGVIANQQRCGDYTFPKKIVKCCDVCCKIEAKRLNSTSVACSGQTVSATFSLKNLCPNPLIVKPEAAVGFPPIATITPPSPITLGSTPISVTITFIMPPCTPNTVKAFKVHFVLFDPLTNQRCGISSNTFEVKCCNPCCDIKLQSAPPNPQPCMAPGEERVLDYCFKNPCPQPITYSFANSYNCVLFTPQTITISGNAVDCVKVKIKMPTNALPCNSVKFEFKVKATNCSLVAPNPRLFSTMIPVCCCNDTNIEISSISTTPPNISCSGANNIPKFKEVWFDIKNNCPSGCPSITNLSFTKTDPTGCKSTLIAWPMYIGSATERIKIKVETLSTGCTPGPKTFTLTIKWKCGNVYKTKNVTFTVTVVP